MAVRETGAHPDCETAREASPVWRLSCLSCREVSYCVWVGCVSLCARCLVVLGNLRWSQSLGTTRQERRLVVASRLRRFREAGALRGSAPPPPPVCAVLMGFSSSEKMRHGSLRLYAVTSFSTLHVCAHAKKSPRRRRRAHSTPHTAHGPGQRPRVRASERASIPRGACPGAGGR